MYIYDIGGGSPIRAGTSTRTYGIAIPGALVLLGGIAMGGYPTGSTARNSTEP